MNKIYLFGLLLLLVAQNIFAQKSIRYKVLEIDSVSNYYFITVKKNFKKYLIVSNNYRLTCISCNKIELYKKYEFVLLKYIPAIKIPNRKNFSISIEDRVVWSNGGKYTAYTTNTLSGLCIISYQQ